MKIHEKVILDEDNDDDGYDIDGEENAAKQESTGLRAYMSYTRKLLEIYFLYLDPKAHFEDYQDTFRDLARNAVKVARTIYKVK